MTCTRQGCAVQKRYEIRIVGELDAGPAAAFAPFEVTSGGGVTTINAVLDQAGLHGLLERIRSLGIELLDIRQVRARR